MALLQKQLLSPFYYYFFVNDNIMVEFNGFFKVTSQNLELGNTPGQFFLFVIWVAEITVVCNYTLNIAFPQMR